MNRYCVNCQKEYDFKIKSMEDLDNLVCPVCGAKIDKNSRKPAATGKNGKTAEGTIGNVVGGYFTIKYYFHFVLAVIGLIAFFLHLNGLVSFLSGLIFIPIGAVIGAVLIGELLRGICLGIVVVFIIRHIVRGFLYFVLAKLVKLGNSK